MIIPAIPAAGIAWPIIDLTDPRPAHGDPSGGPNTLSSVASSAASPFGVAVPCASTSPIDPRSRGSSPARCQARSSDRTWLSGLGFITLDARPSLETPEPRMTA